MKTGKMARFRRCASILSEECNARPCNSAHVRCRLAPTTGSRDFNAACRLFRRRRVSSEYHKEERTMTAKVSLGFAKVSDMELDNFTQGVIAKMTGNPTYPTPPVNMAALGTA